VVKVILELHVAFSSFVLQILPHAYILLSVQELESLVIPYCHVFENHLHFLPLLLTCPSTSSYHHQAMVPILRHIFITDFNAVLYHCLILHSFYFSSRTENVLKHPFKLKYMKLSSNEPSYA
jgi:hypothetical protein